MKLGTESVYDRIHPGSAALRRCIWLLILKALLRAPQRTEAGSKMEIITGVERRRRWRAEDKLRIVAELEQPGACFAEVARRHEVSRGLLWNWRRQVRAGTLRSHADLQFLPVQVMCDVPPPEPTPASRSSSSRRQQVVGDAAIEITLLDGTTLRVGRDVGTPALRRVLGALRR
jgi:transposase